MKIGKALKRIIYLVLGIVVLLTLIMVGIYIAIQPPALPVPAQEDRVFSDVTIWNPGTDVQEHQTIIVSNGIITEIRPTTISDPETKCNGCYVMPGLIDAHVHTPPQLAIGNQELFSLLYLQYGVTTVRDLGQFDDSLPDLRDRLNQGKLVGRECI